jgi:electron transport complex protein RnfG
MKKSILMPILVIALCAALVFGANAGLAGLHRENSLEQHMVDMSTLLPGSESFVVEPYAGEDANIVSVHKSDVGYVIETRSYGYAGNITVLVGVSNEGKVTGLVVRDLSETFGLGANALSDVDFLAQFLNTEGNVAIGTPGADAFSGATGESETTGEETYVDAITGATVTSKAIARCVNSAVAYVTGADVASSATSWGG